MRILLTLASCAVATATASVFLTDPSYVVQIHSSRDAFSPPVDAETPLRSQLMTTASGDRFECFLPQSEPRKQSDRATDAGINQSDDPVKDLLQFSRAASQKIRPKCLQYVDDDDKTVYEICPGVLIRKIQLGNRNEEAAAGSVDGEKKAHKMNHNEIHELASYESDQLEDAQSYSQYIGDVQDRLPATPLAVYTQTFEAKSETDEALDAIKVQFVCYAAARDDFVDAVRWRKEDTGVKEPAAFLIASRVFCNPKHSGGTGSEAFSVSSLLRPLKESRTCVKRNEGWWTYEFCFGQGIRQYHRETDGKLSAEFSLGFYDDKENQDLEASGGALIADHIDATYDSTRPAFLEKYSGGTLCKEFGYAHPRKAKVLYYCSQRSVNHLLLSIKETQTCSYTIKISTPAVCDHPHFISDEPQAEQKPSVIHCVPVAAQVATEGGVSTPQSSSSPPDATGIREVQVAAT